MASEADVLTFVDVVGVDAVRGLHERTVLLAVAVEQEAVLLAGGFLSVEEHHVAPRACRDTKLEAAGGVEAVAPPTCVTWEGPHPHLLMNRAVPAWFRTGGGLTWTDLL